MVGTSLKRKPCCPLALRSEVVRSRQHSSDKVTTLLTLCLPKKMYFHRECVCLMEHGLCVPQSNRLTHQYFPPPRLYSIPFDYVRSQKEEARRFLPRRRPNTLTTKRSKTLASIRDD